MVFKTMRRDCVLMKTIHILLIFLIFAAGCIQPAAPPVVTILPTDFPPGTLVDDKSLSVRAERIDSTKILITYEGGRDADQLIELETVVINSRGSATIQSMGSRLDTTPVQRGGSDIIHGPFSENVHVTITGYFFNGTHQNILDTWI